MARPSGAYSSGTPPRGDPPPPNPPPSSPSPGHPPPKKPSPPPPPPPRTPPPGARVFKRCDQCDVYKPEMLFAPYRGEGNTKRCAQCRHLMYDTGFRVMRPIYLLPFSAISRLSESSQENTRIMERACRYSAVESSGGARMAKHFKARRIRGDIT